MRRVRMESLKREETESRIKVKRSATKNWSESKGPEGLRKQEKNFFKHVKVHPSQEVILTVVEAVRNEEEIEVKK